MTGRLRRAGATEGHAGAKIDPVLALETRDRRIFWSGWKSWGMMMGMESDYRDDSRDAASISWSRVMVAIVVGIAAALAVHYFWPLASH
jgi:hypothetical protein